MKRPLSGAFLIISIAALSLAGCGAPDPGWIEVEGQYWYPSFDITMEISRDGDGMVSYAVVRYEYNAGDGWELGFERNLRFGSSRDGVLEFQAEGAPAPDEPLEAAGDQSLQHRITASTLVRSFPGQPLEIGRTVEHYFHIDTIPPSAEMGDLTITHLPFIPAGDNFSADIDHVEFADPSGSPVRVCVVRAGETFAEWAECIDGARTIEVWRDIVPSHSEVRRFMVVDEAGNRSAVREETFSY